MYATKSISLTASPCGHRARMNSLSEETVVEGSYFVGPISVPSKRRNLTSIGSFPLAISSPPDRRRGAHRTSSSQDPRSPGSKAHRRQEQGSGKKSTETRASWEFDDEFLLPRGVKARGRQLGGGGEEDESQGGERERDGVVGFLLSVRVLTDTPKHKFLIVVLASSHGVDGA